MDNRLQNLGFAANFSSNAFNIVGNSMQVGGAGIESCADTILRLNSPGSTMAYMSGSQGIKRKWSSIGGSLTEHVSSSLSLGLGRSTSSSDSKGSSATACTTMSSAKETDEESSMDFELDFALHLGNEKLPSPKKPANSKLRALELQPKVDLELSLSTGLSESEITCVNPSFTSALSGMEMALVAGGAQNADEGSTPFHWKRGIAIQPLQTSFNPGASFLFKQVPQKIDSPAIVPELSSSILTTPNSSVSCSSGMTQKQQSQHRSSNSKTCQVEGCGKGARGASGRCISHGGGRRCQRSGCHKGAEGRTVYCKAHGGGRRCEFLGCTKSAEGRTDFCIAHGGGRRCSHEGCTRAARGKSGLCIRHGGGKRCQRENCTKSAEGLSGLCISHGGGRRCQAIGCTKGAQGSTMFCKAHGGGKRCTALGCTKGAEGSTPYCKGHGGGKRCAFQGGGHCTKSVHGGTNFCVAHGGGKRCAMPECTKSARGRTDYCVRHGGERDASLKDAVRVHKAALTSVRHMVEERDAHGDILDQFLVAKLLVLVTHLQGGKTGLCALHSGLVQDKRVHGGITLGPMVQDPKLGKSDKKKEVATADDMNVDVMNIGSSIRTSATGTCSDMKQAGQSSAPVLIPEGRVHGGSLMALLAGGSDSNANSRGSNSSGPKKSYVMPQNWM